MPSIGGMCVPLAACLSLVLVTTAAIAQDVPAGFAKCVAEKIDSRRLACFDAEMARLAGQAVAPRPAAAATAAPVAVVAAATAAASVPAPAAASAPSAEEKFGARGELAREIEGKDPAHDAGNGELEATVTGIDRRPYGELVVTLDNGQVWQQLTMSQAIRLKVGETVTIKSGALGSYSLSGAQRGSIKVKRIK